jgi:hypothetical protein
MMKHPNEEELIAYHDGAIADDPGPRDDIGAHVRECPECQAEFERINAVLAALDAMPIPEPGDDYGQRVWLQIAPRLPDRQPRWWDFGLSKHAASGGTWWTDLFAPRRLAAFGTIAALVIVAFVAGWVTRTHVGPTPLTGDASKVRERVLIMAVGEHLGRSEMVLVELANLGPASGGAARPVNIAAEQRRAEDLLEENRLYRQTALEQGDAGLASVLDELERVLLDVAHSPQQVSTGQLETIRQRIETRGILFKVRVVSKQLQQREESRQPWSGESAPTKGERNKT